MELRVVTSDGKATAETHRIEETTDAAFAPGWHYTIEGIEELYFQKDSAGNVRTIAEKDLDKAVLSRFTPSDPLIVPGLEPGQSIKSAHKVKVFDLVELGKRHTFGIARGHLYLRWNVSGDRAQRDL
jgi:hypothetical protein